MVLRRQCNTRTRASSDNNENGDSNQNPDTDMLARQLSQAANRLRSTLDEEGFKDAFLENPSVLGPFGAQVCLLTATSVLRSDHLPVGVATPVISHALIHKPLYPDSQNVGLEDTVFREVGPPTVGAEDFELSTELGRMSVQQVSTARPQDFC